MLVKTPVLMGVTEKYLVQVHKVLHHRHQMNYDSNYPTHIMALKDRESDIVSLHNTFNYTWDSLSNEFDLGEEVEGVPTGIAIQYLGGHIYPFWTYIAAYQVHNDYFILSSDLIPIYHEDSYSLQQWQGVNILPNQSEAILSELLADSDKTKLYEHTIGG